MVRRRPAAAAEAAADDDADDDAEIGRTAAPAGAVRSTSEARGAAAVAPPQRSSLSALPPRPSKIDFTPIRCATRPRPLLMHNITPGVNADGTQEEASSCPRLCYIERTLHCSVVVATCGRHCK